MLTVCVASFVRGAAGYTVADQKALLVFKAQFDDPAGILKSWSPKDSIQPPRAWNRLPRKKNTVSFVISNGKLGSRGKFIKHRRK